MPQPLRYRGYVYDRELTGRGEASGWYWLGVRSYDPNIGRFIQPDPSEQEGTRSYVYCGDAPLDCSDPSGLLSLEDVLNPFGIVTRATGIGLMVAGGGLTALGILQGMGMDPGSGPNMPSLQLAGSALMGAGFSLLTGEGVGGGGEGRFGRISEDAAGGGGVARAAGKAGAVQSEEAPHFVEFAHGTTHGPAADITTNGLNRDALLAGDVGSRRPGSFFTIRVDPANPYEALGTAASWGGRHEGDVCVVICRLPTSVVSDLEGAGTLVHRARPNESIFHPDSFATVNREAIWKILNARRGGA